MAGGSILTKTLQGEGSSWDVFFHLKQKDVGSKDCYLLLGFEMSTCTLEKCRSHLVISKGAILGQSAKNVLRMAELKMSRTDLVSLCIF